MMVTKDPTWDENLCRSMLFEVGGIVAKPAKLSPVDMQIICTNKESFGKVRSGFLDVFPSFDHKNRTGCFLNPVLVLYTLR